MGISNVVGNKTKAKVIPFKADRYGKEAIEDQQTGVSTNSMRKEVL